MKNNINRIRGRIPMRRIAHVAMVADSNLYRLANGKIDPSLSTAFRITVALSVVSGRDLSVEDVFEMSPSREHLERSGQLRLPLEDGEAVRVPATPAA